MKIRNRLISMLLCIIMVVGLLPLTAMAAETDTSGYCGLNVKWNYNADTKTLTISGTGKMEDYDHEWGAKVTPWNNYRNILRPFQNKSSGFQSIRLLRVSCL